MSALSRWLLIPPVSARLSERYQGYRRHGASPFSAALGCLWMILAWIVFPLEHPRWQRIRDGHKALYPHINAARPRPLDPARYLIQTLWLVMISSTKERHEPRWRSFARLKDVRGRYHQWMDTLPERVRQKTTHLEKEKELGHLSNGARRFILGVIVTFSLILALICITQPFNPLSQFIFLLLLWGVALLVRRMPGRFSALMLIVLSLTVSCRYIWWRYTSTLNWDDPVSLVCGLILLFAETYAWIVLVLGYFQVVWPLNRQPVPLPKEMSQWPTVDIFVPTYNEDLNVVKNTIYASLGIDWPKDKLNIWILDDGGRESFRQFARHVGVHYIARATHEHAKAGNINNALKHAKGEFVAIFDCDHVPTRSFLQMTMGWFLKEKQLAMMQTPHHFFSPDPFERNLGRFRKTPNEGTLFYGLVQDGNDMWDATFFCGSCAVIRRKPLDEIGGIAVETVTEDAHTSLRLHRRGYTSAYMRIPQAAGLATESLSAHIGQRIRWARGMVQIFRLDNPLFGKGLKLAQRLCYLNAMFHFLSGIPRLIFLTAPSREVKLTFAQIAPPPGSMALRGVNPNGGIEFGMRSDEVASKAVLNLEYTPSPSLLPVQSQLKVYLNDELMGVLPVTKEQLGKKTLAQVPINPLFITDFNRVRLEFVGHYRDVCENPASSTLWLDIGRNSALDLTYNMLAVNNDLSHFPVPFFDPRDNRPVTLPIVFADMPDLAQQQAASIVASWFGSRAGWRGQRFPVLYNHLPDRNAIVFATNDRRPDFLRDHPAVNAPVIEMMSHPDNPYVKLLVVFGRDDKDLLQAAKGIAQGNILFRGSSVVVNDVKPLLARKPYDAPNWVRTDRPVTFGELKTYEEQLQSSGLEPAPINVSLNLPPDLYLLRSNGIDMDLNYRYTSPPTKDSSRLDISLNNQFLQAFSLNSTQETNRLLLRLPVLQGLLDGKTDVSIPALKLGAMNQLRFDFRYMNPMPGGSVDNCITFQPVPNHVVIGDDSTIDFSKYYHFIAMPDLRAFANAGFPFSRMADLSDTLAVMPKTPTEAQMETLLNTVGAIGGQTGFPAINLTITDDSAQIADKDADLLIIGAIPGKLKDDKRIDLLVQATQSWVKTPMRQTAFPSIMPDEADRAADAQSTVTASGPMAAVVGFQSPFNDQRSVIALLADSPRGYQLLNDAVNDSGKRAAMFGSVAVIRESGVHSLRVGDIYYVGHLPWFERLWYALANHPVLLAVLAALSVVLLAWVLWRLLRILSRRRLDPDHE
ncbi:TPA: cellulose biosynthesis cyclic di-GMP-binding regulatory protein BcsB [Salmonella enterica]|nr:cellulose biosynthesis cyclic di-GMP-binding regulatory protein BcsB [Salmonella enterica subsp. enterica serovar Tennessee]ECG3023728.1 cellulose biosynthesis cyclic di-GMP-binding regulatory protein BcsB [Salmonella enterica subsp. enterica serovar Tennessee]EDT2091646.1 cellulose biosynthesis cyclic di-GMP-binding regulatory protein BcsB [Salmonella enterica subsp. enterica serovar Rissen]